MNVNIYSRWRRPVMPMIIVGGMMMIFPDIAMFYATWHKTGYRTQQDKYPQHFLYIIFHKNNFISLSWKNLARNDRA
jgi:hypothetical protein